MKKYWKLCILAAAVAAVTLVACGAPPVSESAPPPPSSSESGTAAQETGESTVFGIIEDAAMNSLVIKTEEGETLSFGTADADKTNCDGLTIGSGVRVYYTGEIKSEDTSGAVVVRLEQDPDIV